MKNNKNKGFSILEVVVSVAIFAFILLLLMSIFFQFNFLNFKTKADREALENARKVMDMISYEAKGAKSIYTPTTNLNQLSLETTRYLPTGETASFIDFFICNTAVCLKKEFQAPVQLTSDNVIVRKMEFSNVISATGSSVKIDLTIDKKNPTSDQSQYSSINLTQT